MVFLQNILFRELKPKKVRPFLDSLRLNVKGGHAGNGMPKYGGIGGQGGAVYFEAKEEVTLKNVLHKFSNKRVLAGNGEDANKERILGRRGADVKVQVPVGITVIDENGTALAELNNEGQTCLAAGGGGGGCSGNQFIGQKGQNKTIRLDLKLIADIGLVGFPNAGKSSFLKTISNASPKIASYPFTTIQPQIGTIEYQDYRQITVADLPGLIEGAHANIGMGHKFLKHVERTSLLLLIIDIFGFRLSNKHHQRNCLENIYALNKELEMYDPTLLEKPCVLLVNKMDLDGSIEQYMKNEKYFNDLTEGLNECPEEIRPNQLLKFERIIPISAKTNKEIDKVKLQVREVLDSAEKRKTINEEIIRNPNEELREKRRERGPKMV
ncbi:unnamed protein product [Diamesa tonsa]